MRAFKGRFSAFFSKGSEKGAFFFRCVRELLEAFAADQDRCVIGKKGKELAFGFEPVFHVIVQRNHLLYIVFAAGEERRRD